MSDKLEQKSTEKNKFPQVQPALAEIEAKGIKHTDKASTVKIIKKPAAKKFKKTLDYIIRSASVAVVVVAVLFVTFFSKSAEAKRVDAMISDTGAVTENSTSNNEGSETDINTEVNEAISNAVAGLVSKNSLPLISTKKASTDLNDEQINSICTVLSSTLNRPSGVTGICLTLGTTPAGGVKSQLILSATLKIYMRYKAGNGANYTKWSEISAASNTQTEIKASTEIDAFGIFDTVGFIGDSLGSGYADANGKITKDNPGLQKNDYDVSWLQFICRKTGRTGYNFSVAGATTRSWLKTSQANNTGINMLTDGHHRCQAYIIGLGVNDARNETVPLADFSANYARIINTIRSVSEKAPIFCITIPKSDKGAYSTVSSYNNAITDIVKNNAENGVYLIEPEIDKINTMFNQYKDIYHFSALGYTKIAEYMLELLNACVEENKDDFVQLNLLDSDPEEYYTKAEVDALIESLKNK
ncbi:MAG: SGNH/GDSL hydrolase family protein [Ruminococcus sp.]|nr:SGNH/GDSL hydrolase family protein [Ruminococcus sp.]